MKNHLKSILLISAITLSNCSNYQPLAEADCISLIRGVTEMPFKNDLPAEGNYYHLLSISGDKAVTDCLLNQVTNTSRMPDPRMSVPNKREFVAIGDVAIFMLVEMYDMSFTTFMDEKEWDNMGIFSYFKYVETEGAREGIQATLRDEIVL
jgi:hypothetical protein